jgi:hypothetical protein
MGGLTGGGGAGGSQTTTTQQTQAPWGPMQPYLTGVMQSAQNLYNQGVPQLYSGQYLPSLSPWTTQGQGGIANLAGQPQNLIQQGQNITGQVASGANQGAGNQYLQQLLSGQGQMGGYIAGLPGGMGTGNQAQNTAQGLLSSIAGGSNLNAGNPYLNQMYQAASQPIMQNWQNQVQPGIESAFTAAGRYGGGGAGSAMNTAMNQASTTLGNTLGNLQANLYGNAYNTDIGQQTAALQSLGALGTTQTGQNLQLGQMLGNLGVTGAQALNQQQLNQGQLQLSAAGQLPGQQAAGYQPYQALMGIGQQQDQYNTQNQLYQEQLYNYLNGQGAWSNLQNYANVLYGNPASRMMDTTGTTTAQAPTTGLFGNILSGATGLGSMIAGAPQLGAGLSSIGGGLSSLFGSGAGLAAGASSIGSASSLLPALAML